MSCKGAAVIGAEDFTLSFFPEPNNFLNIRLS